MTDGKLLTKSVKVESKSFIGLKEKKNTANSEYSKKNLPGYLDSLLAAVLISRNLKKWYLQIKGKWSQMEA